MDRKNLVSMLNPFDRNEPYLRSKEVDQEGIKGYYFPMRGRIYKLF